MGETRDDEATADQTVPMAPLSSGPLRTPGPQPVTAPVPPPAPAADAGTPIQPPSGPIGKKVSGPGKSGQKKITNPTAGSAAAAPMGSDLAFETLDARHRHSETKPIVEDEP